MSDDSQVTVHFVDGETLRGNFVGQDEFNVILLVDAEELMIPRNQIRFIKRERPDLAQAPPPPQEPEPAVESTKPPVAPQEDATFVVEPEEPPPTDEDDSTLALSDDELLDSLGKIGGKEREDSDPTFVLDPEEAEADAEATYVISSQQAVTDLEDEDTFIFDTPAPKKMVAQLVCTGGPHKDEVFELRGEIVTMGRSTDNVVTLSYDKEISRRHAIIRQENGQYVIEDQNSLNGTFVNDERVSGSRVLEPGDVIMVGVSYLEYQENYE